MFCTVRDFPCFVLSETYKLIGTVVLRFWGKVAEPTARRFMGTAVCWASCRHNAHSDSEEDYIEPFHTKQVGLAAPAARVAIWVDHRLA